MQKKKLIWFIGSALMGISVVTALVVLTFSYFQNLRSETKLLMELSQNIGVKFEREERGKDLNSLDSSFKSTFWSPAQLALFDKQGVLKVGESLGSDDPKFFKQFSITSGEHWEWDEKGLNYFRPIESGIYQNHWLRVRFPETPKAWDIDFLPFSSALLVLFFGIVGMSWYVTQRLKSPLDSLKFGVNRIRQGEYVKLAPSEWEELDLLVRAMNTMVYELDQKMRYLDEQKQEKGAILSSLDEGVLAMDLRGRIIDANAKAIQILNLGERDEWLKKPLGEKIRNSKLNEMVVALISGQNVDAIEIQLEAYFGRMDIEVRGTPLCEQDQKPRGIVLILADLTHLHHLEKVRRDFVANVSHELRTPITSIQGFAETLIEMNPDFVEQRQKFLGIIYRQSLRLSQIIEDLLELSRLEEQMRQGEIEKIPLNLKDILDHCVDLAFELAKEKEIQILQHVQDEFMLNANSHLLEQAFLNLLTNAIRYSDSQKSIQIHCKIESQNLIVSFKDEGIGIPADAINRIFERFYRVDKARSKDRGGTGLGLSIVKNIVLAHKGEIWVESVVGKGSTFYLRFPFQFFSLPQS